MSLSEYVKKGNILISSLDREGAKELQGLLAQAGLFNDKIDGIPGAKTQKAFANFKSSVWLSDPELLGKSSLEKLLELGEEAKRKIPSQESNHAIPADKSSSIIPGGSFTWAEATHNGTRQPQSDVVREGIIRLARQIQPYRDRVGQPFVVTSWYRPPAINRRVGGARYSRHLVGDAMDFYIPGRSAKGIAAEYFRDWPGGLGIYPRMPNILHADARPGKSRWGGAPW